MSEPFPNIRIWHRAAPDAIVIRFVRDLTNDEVERIAKALMVAQQIASLDPDRRRPECPMGDKPCHNPKCAVRCGMLDDDDESTVRRGQVMVTPSDWIPPFPPGDERNTRHRAYYDRFLRIFPAAPASAATEAVPVPSQGVFMTERCTLCDPRPEATPEQCDKWPGHYCGCLIRDHGPTNGWTCDGKGNLTPHQQNSSEKGNTP